MYLIHSNFEGKVNILFDKNAGETKKYQGDRRIYEIPSDGILITQFKANYGFVNRQYYSVDDKGGRTPLEIFEYDNKNNNKWIIVDKNQKGIFLDGISGQYGNTGDSTAVEYQEFIVSNYNKLDSFFTKEYQTNFDNKLAKITGLTFNLK